MGADQGPGGLGSRVRVLRQGGGKSVPKAPPSPAQPIPPAHLLPQPAPLPEWAVRWGLRVAGGGPRWGVRGGGPLAHRTSTPGLSCPSSPVPPGPSSDEERNLGYGDGEDVWGNTLDPSPASATTDIAHGSEPSMSHYHSRHQP